MIDLEALEKIYDKAEWNDNKEVTISTDMLLDIIVEIRRLRESFSGKFTTKYKNKYSNLGAKK